MNEPIYTWVLNTFKSLPYLKLAIESIRKNAFYKNQPIIVYCENDTETRDWLLEQTDIETIYETNEVPKGIGGGVNEAVSRVKTEFFNLIHSDMYISRHYDKPLYELASMTQEPLLVGGWRAEPNLWRKPSRMGTIMVPPNNEEGFGVYHHDFDIENFERWADEFVLSGAPDFRKVEGVSYMMRTKYFVPNASIWAPASMEDHCQSVRMQLLNYKFIITGNAMVWHFGARGSIFLGQQDKLVGRSDRQMECELRNTKLWLQIWQEWPVFDDAGFIKITDGMRRMYDRYGDVLIRGDYAKILQDR